MKTIDEAFEKAVYPENQIGEGRFRRVYRFQDKAVKILKRKVKKDYWLFSVSFPTGTYTYLKYGVRDFNEHEFKVYNLLERRLPDEFRDNFGKVLDLGYSIYGSLLVSELILDSKCQVSQDIKCRGKIKDESFWKRLDQIVEFLSDNRIYFLDINPGNILAREVNGVLIPVFIDYKRIGPQTFPFKSWLRIKSLAERAFRRKMNRLKEEFKE